MSGSERDSTAAETERDAEPTAGVDTPAEEATAAATADAQPAAAGSESSDSGPRASEAGAEATVEKITGESDDDVLSSPEGIEFRYHGRTDVGLVREHNEDNFLVADFSHDKRGHSRDEVMHAGLGTRGAVLSVCDGMGGAAAGEVASQMAVDTIYDVLSHGTPPSNRDHFARRLVRAIEEAGDRIFSAAKVDRSRRGMGTTSTVAGLVDKVLFVGQVGDSRAYLLRRGKLAQITKDQSLVNQLIEAGQLSEEEAEAFEHSNIILQALGTTEEVQVDLTFVELRAGDRLMLCSDGLSGLVHNDMIREVMGSTPDLSECARKLIELANAGGGHDNVTVVCAEFTGAGLPEPGEGDEVGYMQYPLPEPEPGELESLPPARSSHKPGSRKPGADVKTEADGAALSEGGSSTPWVVALLIVLVGFGAWFMSGLGKEMPAAANGAGGQSSEAALAPEEDVVAVLLKTDIVGELWVDGEWIGDLEGGDVEFDLDPGAHRLEARANGSVIRSTVLTVRSGVAAVVELRMPEGVDGAGEDADGADAADEGEQGAEAEGAEGAGTGDEGGTDQSGADTSPALTPAQKAQKAQEARIAAERERRRLLREERAAQRARQAAAATETPTMSATMRAPANTTAPPAGETTMQVDPAPAPAPTPAAPPAETP